MFFTASHLSVLTPTAELPCKAPAHREQLGGQCLAQGQQELGIDRWSHKWWTTALPTDPQLSRRWRRWFGVKKKMYTLNTALYKSTTLSYYSSCCFYFKTVSDFSQFSLSSLGLRRPLHSGWTQHLLNFCKKSPDLRYLYRTWVFLFFILCCSILPQSLSVVNVVYVSVLVPM